MIFDVKKDTGIIPHILTQILDYCVNGVTLSDPDLPDNPIIYANKAFEAISGYPKAEIIGLNCRFLQGNDTDQPAVRELHQAIQEKKAVEVILRNYRKNGEMFYNRLTVSPLFDNRGQVIYFLGVQYDITQQINASTEIEALNERLSLCINTK
jgi:PAS domain S-box-containing protein